MLHRDNDTDRRVDSELIELQPTAWRYVAGGSPTLPLPPPAPERADLILRDQAVIW
jgi:hypothetical protein